MEVPLPDLDFVLDDPAHLPLVVEVHLAVVDEERCRAPTELVDDPCRDHAADCRRSRQHDELHDRCDIDRPIL